MSEVELVVEVDADLFERFKTACELHGISAEEFLTAFVQCATERKDIFVPREEVLKRAKLNRSSQVAE